MIGVNKLFLVGNLGQDPESRQTNSGSTVCNFSVAVGERRKTPDGTWGEHTEWFNCVAFGKTAETVVRYLTKGRQVHVEGRVQTRKWQDRDGNDRKSTEVVCDRVTFIGNRGDSDGARGNGRSYGGGGGYAQGAAQGGDMGGADDSIPF